MLIVRAWLAVCLLALLTSFGAAVHAQSAVNHAVVLVAGSDVSGSKRAAFSALMESLGRDLEPEDQIAVILYTDIVEHIAPLAPPSPELPAEIARLLDGLPKISATNGAIGLDRALELLKDESAQRSIIIIGELDIRLEDDSLLSRYSRWLDGTLLPSVAEEQIALMAVSDQAGLQRMQQRFSDGTFTNQIDVAQDPATIAALALLHVQTPAPITLAQAPDSTPDSANSSTLTQELPDAPAVLPDALQQGQSPETIANSLIGADPESVESLNRSADETIVASTDVTTAGVESTTTQLVNTTTTESRGLLDKLSTFAMMPVIILGVIMLALIALAAYYFLNKQNKRPSRRRNASRSRQMDGSLSSSDMDDWDSQMDPMDEIGTRQSAFEAAPQGDARFDALVDTLAARPQETLATAHRHNNATADIRARRDQATTLGAVASTDPRTTETVVAQPTAASLRTSETVVVQPTAASLRTSETTEADLTAAKLRTAETIISPEQSDERSNAETEDASDQTIDTRTVDAPRKRTSTVDLTRELEDLTRARNKQYDFD